MTGTDINSSTSLRHQFWKLIRQQLEDRLGDYLRDQFWRKRESSIMRQIGNQVSTALGEQW